MNEFLVGLAILFWFVVARAIVWGMTHPEEAKKILQPLLKWEEEEEEE